jgi:hypothetical protein
MNVRNFISALSCLIMITACSVKQDGSEYVGKWKDMKGGIEEFVKDGDAIFFVAEGKKVPATRNQDNTLNLNGIVFSYSKSSDSIFFTTPFGGSQELKRVK